MADNNAIKTEIKHDADLKQDIISIASPTTDKNISNLNKDISQDNYCNVRKTVVNDVPIRIFDPGNAVPKLYIGKLETIDYHAVLVCQAADVREDGNGMVGSCINNGKIISKGLSQIGYVAIINGNTRIGADLNSPYFEEAIQCNGAFFRQFALVKDGLMIDNNLKNKRIHRAICEWNGKIIVVQSECKESFHDFSQALIDYGVNNAVSLVGGDAAHGFCRNDSDEYEEWGSVTDKDLDYVSCLVWER